MTHHIPPYSFPVSILFNPDIYSAVKQMVDGSWIDKKKWENLSHAQWLINKLN